MSISCSICGDRCLARGLCKKHYHEEYRRTHKLEFAGYYAKYREKNKAKRNVYSREYGRVHRAEISRYLRERKQRDPNYRIACCLRYRMNKAIKGEYKSGSAVKDLGCSIGAFRLYIENQFEPGMSWDNYGEWHLDHVQPLASFDLTDRSQFLTACNWLNYQPLWSEDNFKKGGREVGFSTK